MLNKLLTLFIVILILQPDCRSDDTGRQVLQSEEQLVISNCLPADVKSCIQTLSKPWEHPMSNPPSCNVDTSKFWKDYKQEVPPQCRSIYMSAPSGQDPDLSWEIYKNYGANVIMNGIGMTENRGDTEGVYIKCNPDATMNQCLNNNKFSITTDIKQATPSSNIALNKATGKSIQNNGKDSYCPLTHCDVNFNKIRFYDGHTSYTLGKGESSQKASVAGTTEKVSLYTVMQAGNNLCLMLNTPSGYVTLGCKAYYDTTKQQNHNLIPPGNCFANTACNSGDRGSKVFWSVSSRVIECLSDTINIALLDTCGDAPPINNLQWYLRMPIMAALLLYIVLLGVKISTNGALPKSSEIIMDIIKIAVVLWLAVGTTNTKIPENSPDYYKTGLPWIYSTGKAAMHSFASYILTAASTDGLCTYKETDYKQGKEYLAIWDSLDCRVAYYFGLYRLTGDYTTSGIYGVFGILIPALLSVELIFVMLLIVYGLFVLALLIYFVEFYATCLIMLAVVVYLGVIMVPFILFGFTKKFFDSWLALVLSYVFQPVIVMGFLSLGLLVFDTVIFGKCRFTEKKVGSYSYWSIDSSDCSASSNDPRCTSSADSCKSTFGYKFLQTLGNDSITAQSGLFADYVTLNMNLISDMPTIILSLLKIAIFGYLLLMFSENINSIAADLSGGIRLETVNVAKLATDMIKSAISNETGGVVKAEDSPKNGPEAKTERGGAKDSGIAAAATKAATK